MRRASRSCRSPRGGRPSPLGVELPLDVRPLRFGSWVGGDRDGNPFVTADILRSTLQTQADKVLEAASTEDDQGLYEAQREVFLYLVGQVSSSIENIALHELVTNAVVHAGTPVQVTCRLADSAVEVVVLDREQLQALASAH